MLLTGLEKGVLFAQERWGCVPIQSHSFKKKNKTTRSDHKTTTSQRGVSDCIWCLPSAIRCCTKHISMLTKQEALFLPILTVKLCFWRCCYTNQEDIVSSEKTPRVCDSKEMTI